MERRTVQLEIGGHSYRVVSSAPEAELQHLAQAVNDKVAEVVPAGKVAVPQTLVLAAISLAHDLEVERAKRQVLERRSRDLLRRALVRIDDALEGDSRGDP